MVDGLDQLPLVVVYEVAFGAEVISQAAARFAIFATVARPHPVAA